MTVFVVSGQGNNGPLKPPYERGPMHFWSSHHSKPPAQNTLIVHEDGHVVEGWGFTNEDTTDPTVVKVLTGGYRHTVDTGTEEGAFLYDALVDAGYSLTEST